MTCRNNICYHNENLYRFSYETKTYQEAKDECTRNAGSLAVVKDVETWQALSKCCDGDSNEEAFYWIGLRKCKNWFNLQQFRWEEENTCKALPYFSEDSPHFNHHECQAVSVNPNALFNNGFPLSKSEPCNTPKYFVCQYNVNSNNESPSVWGEGKPILLTPYAFIVPIVACLLLFAVVKIYDCNKKRLLANNLKLSSSSSGYNTSATAPPLQHLNRTEHIYEFVSFSDSKPDGNKGDTNGNYKTEKQEGYRTEQTPAINPSLATPNVYVNTNG